VKIILSFMLLVCLLSVGSVAALEQVDLVFYFPFESFDDDTALDQSANAHNGTINGDIEIVEGGKHGNAAKFAKTSFIDLDGLEIPEEHIPVEEISLCAWINCENTGDHHAIFNAQAADATWIMHPEARSEGNFRWLLRGDGGAGICDMRAGKVAWDEWQHFAGIYTGRKAILYINGEQEGEAAGGGDIAGNWQLGARIGYNIDNARPFTGLMDDLSLWKKALTQDEVKLLMEGGPEAILEGEAVSPVGNITTTWGKLKNL